MCTLAKTAAHKLRELLDEERPRSGGDFFFDDDEGGDFFFGGLEFCLRDVGDGDFFFGEVIASLGDQVVLDALEVLTLFVCDLSVFEHLEDFFVTSVDDASEYIGVDLESDWTLCSFTIHVTKSCQCAEAKA